MTSSRKDIKGVRMLLEVRQRRIALAILSFIYSVKGYVWSNFSRLRPQYELTIAGFLALNLFWVMGVNRFKIPRFDSWFVLFLVLSAMSLVDYSITQSLYQNLNKIKSNNSTDLAAKANDHNLDAGDWKSILGTNHIFGSLDVNILPPIYVSFSSELTTCLSLDSNQHVVLNIIANTPPPLTIGLSFYDLNGVVEESKKTLEGVDPKSLEYDETFKQNMYSYSLNAERGGVYRILMADHGNRTSYPVNRLSDTVVIPLCPTANIKPREVPLPDSDRASDLFLSNRCVGTKFGFDLQLTGVPPFEVECLKSVGNNTQTLPINFGDIKGPLLSLDQAHEMQDEKTLNDFLSSLAKSLNPTTTHLSIDIPLEEPSIHQFQLMRITDSTNSTLIYNTDSHNKTYWDNNKHVVPLNAIKSDHVGDSVSVQAQLPPTASFLQSTTELKLFDDVSDAGIIYIELTGSPPWNIVYSIASTESNANKEVFLDTFQLDNVYSTPTSIMAKTPGFYTLKSVSDANCQGTITSNRVISVTLSVKPTLDISIRKLIEKCYGVKGIVFELSFTGEPPFTVQYDETHVESQHTSTKTLVFKKHLELLTLSPKIAGTYKYSFIKFSDNAFNKDVILEDLSFTQTINVPETAKFVSKHLTVCPGNAAVLPIRINGSNEYNIVYSVSKGNYLHKSSITASSSSQPHISLSSLKDRGTYTVNLLSIVDSKGCEGEIVGDSATVEVTSSPPRARFKSNKEEYIVVGSSKTFPIQTEGGGNFTLEILHEEKDRLITVRGQDVITLSISEPGTYTIKSVKNSYCNGVSVPPSSLKVVGIPFPELSLIKDDAITENTDSSTDYSIQNICSGVQRKVGVNFKGYAPFFLRYSYDIKPQNMFLDRSTTIELSDAHTEKLKYLISSTESDHVEYVSPLLNLQSQHERAYINIDSTRIGLQTYHVYSPGDSNYPKTSQNAIHNVTDPALSFSLQVYPTPRAMFLENVKKVYQCIFNEKRTSLLIGFYGKPPFTFVIGMQKDSGPVTHEELVSDDYVYEYQPPPPDAVGMYKYSLHFVRDKNGCQNIIADDAPGNVAYRQIIGIASITPATSSREACRGDVMPFALEGTPPFTIYYTVNGEDMHPIVVREPLLTICAVKSGVLKIDKICDSLGCCSEPNPELSIVVHDLPSITIGDGSNDYLEMREGESADVVFKLSGVPPFSFRYNVVPLSDNPHHKKHDFYEEHLIKSVLMTNVTDTVVKLEASTRGSYKVVMIKDAHCQYPPISKPSLCRQANNIIHAN